jgi:hypothetical protein
MQALSQLGHFRHFVGCLLKPMRLNLAKADINPPKGHRYLHQNRATEAPPQKRRSRITPWTMKRPM